MTETPSEAIARLEKEHIFGYGWKPKPPGFHLKRYYARRLKELQQIADAAGKEREAREKVYAHFKKFVPNLEVVKEYVPGSWESVSHEPLHDVCWKILSESENPPVKWWDGHETVEPSRTVRVHRVKSNIASRNGLLITYGRAGGKIVEKIVPLSGETKDTIGEHKEQGELKHSLALKYLKKYFRN